VAQGSFRNTRPGGQPILRSDERRGLHRGVCRSSRGSPGRRHRLPGCSVGKPQRQGRRERSHAVRDRRWLRCSRCHRSCFNRRGPAAPPIAQGSFRNTGPGQSSLTRSKGIPISPGPSRVVLGAGNPAGKIPPSGVIPERWPRRPHSSPSPTLRRNETASPALLDVAWLSTSAHDGGPTALYRCGGSRAARRDR